MENEKDLKTLVHDYAVENFKSGLNCAESVYDALLRSGALPVPKETIAMCIGFGGGVGLSGSACGALAAAIMANGAVYGRTDPWSVPQDVRGKENIEKYYRRYNQMVREFIAENGSMTCREICAPFADWHGKERRQNCLRLVAAAASMAYEFLQMTQEEAFALPYGENIAGTDRK